MRFNNIGQFVAHLATLPAAIEAAKVEGLRRGAEIIRAEMRGEIGVYQSGDEVLPDWPELADRTKNDKGAPPDDPLLRTGEMRDSIGIRIDSDAAHIGTDDMVAIYQELGTEVNNEPHVPARSFIARAAFRKGEEAAAAIAVPVVNVLSGGRI